MWDTSVVVLRRGGRLAGLAMALVATGIASLGCSGSEPRPLASDLVGRLGILAEQQGFSAGQVRCVADSATRAFAGSDGDLRRFRDELVEFDRTGSLGAMSTGSRKVLTDGISACAVDDGDG